MAKTVRKRVSRASSSNSWKVDHNKTNNNDRNDNNKTNAVESDIPAIQQFQDLIDMQKNEFESARVGLTQQNVQLARSNSGLMVRIREMDKSVSELIQENVVLRSKLSVKEQQFKVRLTETIQTLERGVFQRFDEMLHMFASTRRREGLGVPSDSLSHRSTLLNEPRSILKRNKASQNGHNSAVPRSSTTTIAFNESHNQVFSPEPSSPNPSTQHSTEIAISPPSKKRRKSSRRESLFHPSDFEFSENPDNDEGYSPSKGPTVAIDSLEALPTAQPDDPQPEGTEETMESFEAPPMPSQDPGEDSCNFTNSLIEYSIPEEIAEKIIETSVASDTSAKIQVYHDNSRSAQFDSSQLLPGPITSNFRRDHVQAIDVQPTSFVQNATSSQKKVKHSMKSRGAQKKMIDEVMPTTCGSTNELSDTARSRRTRGKAINYALPSLRAKMRRPTEKLVDATTVTNIRDLQVETGRRKSGSRSRDGTPYTDDEVRIDSVTFTNEEEGSELLKPPLSGNSPPKSIEKPAKIKVLKPLSNTNSPNIPNINPLKDITNNAPAKSSMKTKKLFKKAIVGDLGSENSYSFDESSGNHSTSFRVNEEDLSVFDLLNDLKANSAPKTHRARARQEAEKRGRKPAFRL
ncbi:LANO_0H24036g1_1 [Lachancea nothofagi CBS 11611]|uniref:LANO_0H24036g1_1 n=1 Tax=Lachancea nothofagi CBS 11611 TaxID=1266666 RepID=A0A1G4KNT1_9SACH|nr:LANO_0H24036g1_1 [Lachancea nothofagi CBS 11611]